MIRNWSGAALLCCVLAVSPGAVAQTLVLKGGSVYASPEATPIADAVIVTSAGVITAVGRAGEVQIPPDARVIDCTGKTIVAGFWNSHVHFTEAVWKNAGNAPAAPLTAHMQEMLTRWGFTTVWDLGSHPDDSLPLRRRVNADEVLGPTIYLAGSIFPKDGHPAYLPPELQLPMATTPERGGADGRGFTCNWGWTALKLFTGVLQGGRKTGSEHGCGHRQGRGRCGARAGKAGVRPSAEHDRLGDSDRGRCRCDGTHDPQQRGYTSEQLARFKQQGIALTPTLSLFAKLPRAARDRRAPRRQHCRPAQELLGKRRHGSVRNRRRLHPAL